VKGGDEYSAPTVSALKGLSCQQLLAQQSKAFGVGSDRDLFESHSGHDFAAVRLNRQQETGRNRFVVDEDGTRPADAFTASLPDVTKVQHVREKFAQGRRRRHTALNGLTVDDQVEIDELAVAGAHRPVNSDRMRRTPA
jgi:hypothetical protein